MSAPSAGAGWPASGSPSPRSGLVSSASGAPPCDRDRLDPRAALHPRILERLGDVVDRRRRDAARELGEPFVRRARLERFVDQLGEQRAVLEAIREFPEARIVDPLRPADLVAEHAPELLLVAHQVDPAAARAVALAGRDRRVRGPRDAAGGGAGVEIPVADVVQVREREVEEAHVDVAPAPVAVGGVQRGEQPGRQRDAGHQVDEREPEPRRRRIRVAGEMEVAGLGLHHVVVAGPRRTLALAAVAGEMRADDLRVRRRRAAR